MNVRLKIPNVSKMDMTCFINICGNWKKNIKAIKYFTEVIQLENKSVNIFFYLCNDVMYCLILFFILVKNA